MENLEKIQRWATKMIKGLEAKSYEERLKKTRMFNFEEKAIKRGHDSN